MGALWGMKVNPTPEQLKEIADSLIYFGRNQYKPEIFDQHEGEEGEKFKKLERAILDWRANGAECNGIVSTGEAESIAKEIECALDWWHTNCEDNDIPDFSRPEDVYSAEKVKMLVDNWNPSNSESTMTWARTKKQLMEIKD